MKVVRTNVKFVVYGAAIVLWSSLASAALVPNLSLPYQSIVVAESSRTLTKELTAAAASTDPAIAARAALALGRTKDPAAVPSLVRRARDVSVPVRAMSVYGLGLLADRETTPLDPILAALTDRSAPVRIAGLDAAGRALAAGRGLVASPPATPPLIGAIERLLADPEPVVRGRAAVALAGIPPGEGSIAAWAAAIVGLHLMAERDPEVRWHEAWALRRAFAEAVPESLLTAGLADPSDLVRMQFLSIAAARKEPPTRIEALLADPSWRVQEQAREALRALAGLDRTAHLTAIPAGVVTPAPVAPDRSPALPRPAAPAALARPPASAARLDLPFAPATVAQITGPQAGPHPRVRIGTTQGPIVVRLVPEWAPLTVANFLNLANRGALDGRRWFRIVPNFVAQTGDPDDDGSGPASYTIPAEENPLEQRAGAISMGLEYTEGATPGPIRDSASTQFYITMSPQLHLNRAFTVFGFVESGFSTLGRLTESDRMTRVEQIADD